MCLMKRCKKQNIEKIYSECFGRKTLTSGISFGIIIFAGDEPAKH